MTCSGCICIVSTSVSWVLPSEQALGNRDHIPRLEEDVGFEPAFLEYVAKLDLERFGLALRLAIRESCGSAKRNSLTPPASSTASSTVIPCR